VSALQSGPTDIFFKDGPWDKNVETHWVITILS